jgi:hypothetical protein
MLNPFRWLEVLGRCGRIAARWSRARGIDGPVPTYGRARGTAVHPRRAVQRAIRAAQPASGSWR